MSALNKYGFAVEAEVPYTGIKQPCSTNVGNLKEKFDFGFASADNYLYANTVEEEIKQFNDEFRREYLKNSANIMKMDIDGKEHEVINNLITPYWIKG